MPETAVNKDDLPPPGENDIELARQELWITGSVAFIKNAKEAVIPPVGLEPTTHGFFKSPDLIFFYAVIYSVFLDLEIFLEINRLIRKLSFEFEVEHGTNEIHS